MPLDKLLEIHPVFQNNGGTISIALYGIGNCVFVFSFEPRRSDILDV